MSEPKFVKIPVNINDLRDYKELHKLLQVCKSFINNSESYIKSIIFGEYIKPHWMWAEILKIEDLLIINKLRRPNHRYSHRIEEDEKNNTLIYYSIGENKFGYYGDFRIAPSTGTSSFKPTRYEFNHDGTKIQIIREYGVASTRTHYQKQRYDWYEDIWELDLVAKTFKLISSTI